MGTAAVLVVIWWQAKTNSNWKKRAKDYQNASWDAQSELHKEKIYSQQLAAENENQRKQLAYFWLKADNCFEQHWAIAGIKKVRKKDGYEKDEINELREPLGQKDNICDPMPPLPPRLPTVETDFEPALLLTKTVREGEFKVLVFRLDDMDTFPKNPLAEVDVWSADYGWSFYVRRSNEGTGALSCAFDYILACAKEQGVPHLTAPLIGRDNEAHRIRLCRFYMGKYGFTYVPSLTHANGYITKKLK